MQVLLFLIFFQYLSLQFSGKNTFHHDKKLFAVLLPSVLESNSKVLITTDFLSGIEK